jgi:hypothetical protein
MKSNKLLFLYLLVAGLLPAISASAQTETFSDSNVQYTFDLPETVWKITAKPSATNPNVEYVYGERQSGHLEIRKTALKPDATISDLINGEEQKLQFLNGYVAGKQEDFKGSFGGKVFNYEFVRSGRNMSGRFYFLKTDDKTVYVLRFTGYRDKLRSIRNQTDSIARTFDIKKAK